MKERDELLGRGHDIVLPGDSRPPGSPHLLKIPRTGLERTCHRVRQRFDGSWSDQPAIDPRLDQF